MIAMAKKNPKAFAPLYEKYYLQIFNFIYKRVQNEEATADVTSTVFLKSMLNLSKYEDRGFPFSSWLYRIAINECNMFFRKQSKNVEVSIDSLQIKALENELGNEETENNRKKLLAGLNMLNFDQVNLIELRFFEGRRFKDIGEMLGCSEDNAKVKVYRAIKKLKKVIGEVKR